MSDTKETAWTSYLRERYEPVGDMPYAEETALLFLLNAPEDYGVEDEMLAYAKARPAATLQELIDFFRTIA